MSRCDEPLGLPAVARQQVHTQVRIRFSFSTHQDLKQIGLKLEDLGRHRNLANYDMRPLWQFASATVAGRAENLATDALALLDAIDADPTRRAAAIASLRP
jgi:hypothetical protein